MRTLPKLLCAITLLSMSGLVWASCPEGYELHDRTGDCEKMRGWVGKETKTQVHRSTLPNNLNVNAFWSPPDDDAKEYCRVYYELIPGHSSAAKPFKLSVDLRRGKGKKDYGRNFAHEYGLRFASLLHGDDNGELTKYILNIAEQKYFSVPIMNSRRSPVYVQSNIIRLTAFYIKYMRSINGLSKSDEQLLVDWIEPMLRYQEGRKLNGSADSRAASGVALISWGAVFNDKKRIEKGMKNWAEAVPYVLKSIDNLTRHPTLRGISKKVFSLEDEFNMALAHLIEGHVILDNIGVDLSGLKGNGGKTIHDAVRWWASVIMDPPKTMRSASGIPYFRGLKTISHTEHVGWIPIYLSKYPEKDTNNTLLEIMNTLTGGFSQRPLFQAISLGTVTGCLWNWRQ